MSKPEQDETARVLAEAIRICDKHAIKCAVCSDYPTVLVWTGEENVGYCDKHLPPKRWFSPDGWSGP